MSEASLEIPAASAAAVTAGQAAPAHPVDSDSVAVLRATDRFLRKMVVLAAALLDAELAVFFWLDPAIDSLRLTHSADQKGIGLESLSGVGAEGYCIQHKRFLVIKDALNDTRAQASALSALARLRGVMCSPVLTNEGVMGVLVTANKTGVVPPASAPLPFTARDEEAMQYLSTVTSFAFHCHRDFLRGSASADSLRAVHRLLAYTSQRNINEALGAVNAENLASFANDKDLKSTVVLRPWPEAAPGPQVAPDASSKDKPPFEKPPLEKNTDYLGQKSAFAKNELARETSGRSIESFGGGQIDVSDEYESFCCIQDEARAQDAHFHPELVRNRSFIYEEDRQMPSLLSSRTGSQLRLITLSQPGITFESILSKFGDLYFNLLNSTSMPHLLEEAQTMAREFLGAQHSYVCSVSAENGGSLVVSSSSAVPDIILNLNDLPKEFITSLDWGMVTEIIASSRGMFPANPGLSGRPYSLDRASSRRMQDGYLSRLIPGVKGTSAIIVPMRSPQEYETTEVDEMPSNEMSRLLLLTKDSDRFSAFEKDSVSLFAKILSEAASHVSFKDRNSNLHMPKKVHLGNVSHLSNSFVILLGFDGRFIVGSRDLADVFGSGDCAGHFSDWISSPNEQLLRDIGCAIDMERGVVREEYILTSAAASKGSGIVFDYSILPLVDTYYNCSCAKCAGVSPAGAEDGSAARSPRARSRSPRGSGSRQMSPPPPALTTPHIFGSGCQRKFQGSSFVMIAAKSSSQSLADFRAYCRTPSANPAGWFDDVDSVSRVTEGAKSYAIHELRRSRSRIHGTMDSPMTVMGAPAAQFSRSRSYSEADEYMEHSEDRSSSRLSFPRSLGATEYTAASKPDDLCTWDFNVMNIKDPKLLRRVVFQLFSLALNFEEIRVETKVFLDYLKEVSSHYRDVIFHNFYHATCVTHITFMLVRETEDVITLPKTLRFGLLLSALVHDIHHPGNTNLFEINNKSELAIIYNDQSVLENHHCATAFRLMNRPGLNVLGSMNVDDQRDVRKLMVGAIMATDMSKHADLMEETSVRANHPYTWNPNELTEQIFYAKITLHAADLSNPTRMFPVAFEWAKRIAAEFNEQTKLETAAGLPVLNFMVATDEIAIVKNELSFSTYVVAPMWRGLAKLFPQYNFLLDILSDNASQYEEKLAHLELTAPDDI
jgi:hypothetical protein